MSEDDGRALLQNPKGVFCYSPTGTCQTAFVSATDTSSTIGFAGLYGPMVDQPTQKPGPVEELSPVPGPHKASSFPVTLHFGQSNTPSEECAVSRIETDPLNTAFHSWWWDGPDALTIRYLRRNDSACPTPLN